MPRTMTLLSLLAALALTVVGTAGAAEPVQWRVVPYAWAAGVDGTLAHARLPLTVHPSAGFRDVLEDLDAAAMLAVEAQGEDFGVLADAMWVDVSRTVRAPLGPLALPVDVSADTRTALVALQYRWLRGSDSHLDVLLGARYWSVDTQFAYQFPSGAPVPAPLPPAYRAQQGQNWWDLQLGLKGQHTFANRAFIGGLALVGSGGSDVASDLMLVAGYRVSDRVAWFVGYRRLAADFRTAQGFTFDATLHGPGVGLDYRF